MYLSKYKFIACIMTFAFIIGFADEAFSQRRRRPARRTNRPAQQQQNNANDPFATGNSANAAAQAPPKPDSVPTVYRPRPTDDPLADSMPIFLRPSTAVDDNSTKLRERPPLEYEHLREDDAVFRHTIWRVIDTREKINLPFSYDKMEDNGNQRFFTILYRAAADSLITAFADENFTNPYTTQGFRTKVSGGEVRNNQYNLDNPEIIDSIVVTYKSFPIEEIKQFQIKEEVIFDRESSRFFTRIIAIAPMGPSINNGEVIPDPTGSGRMYPLFWVYYPELRPYLSRFHAYNPKNNAARMTWEDVFENRYFSSYIIKSTMDNPQNKHLFEMSQLKDSPLFQLYEGENIKEKIFNYEQNLWSY